MDSEANNVFQGQAEAWKNIYSYVDFMALKCAVELGIPDIIHSENRPLSVADIASKISNAPSPNIMYLSRIMRLLAHNKIFTSSTLPNSGTGSINAPPTATLYGPTTTSQWLVRDKNELSLAPLLLLQNHPCVRNPWDHVSTCVREGGSAFHKANGSEFKDSTVRNLELSKIFNEAMTCTEKVTVDAILSGLDKDSWNGLKSLVDVGGGNGHVIAEIIKTYPHIKGINFDSPHVIATAPNHIGVSNVGGYMLDAIPSAQAVLFKWIMHNWDDESCVKILNNCKKAIPEKTGKIFIVDIVLNPLCHELFGNTGLTFDLVMMALNTGMLRTELQWKSILEQGGFPHYKITQLPTIYSIIEAYPN